MGYHFDIEYLNRKTEKLDFAVSLGSNWKQWNRDEGSDADQIAYETLKAFQQWADSSNQILAQIVGRDLIVSIENDKLTVHSDGLTEAIWEIVTSVYLNLFDQFGRTMSTSLEFHDFAYPELDKFSRILISAPFGPIKDELSKRVQQTIITTLRSNLTDTEATRTLLASQPVAGDDTTYSLQLSWNSETSLEEAIEPLSDDLDLRPFTFENTYRWHADQMDTVDHEFWTNDTVIRLGPTPASRDTLWMGLLYLLQTGHQFTIESFATDTDEI